MSARVFERLSSRLTLAAAFGLLGLACGKAAPILPPADRDSPACAHRVFEGEPYTVCTFFSTSEDIRIDWADANGAALGSFEALQRALGPASKRVRFAMNAGMFENDGHPLGLYVEDGRVLRAARTDDGAGNFFLKPNGMFSVDADGAVHVESTDAYLARAPSPRWATQSGPMLVIDGAMNAKFQDDGPSRLIRNGVGQIDPNTAAFVISDAPVAFGRFARVLRDDLHCKNALFLDGTVSSLWSPAMGRRDRAHRLGPMVTIMDRPAR